MKQILTYTLIIISSLWSKNAFSQWYFETGVNNSKFSQFKDNPTTLSSYGGFRDFSNAIGYVFPTNLLKDRAQFDAKATKLGLKIGVGFDQMNLKEKAAQQNSEAFLHYDLAQLQVRLGVLFTQTLVYKKQRNSIGMRQPAMNLILDAGMSYNFYTSATRSLLNSSGSIVDLKADNEFEQSYPAYVFGAGFEFPLNKYSALYAKYEFENAFSNSEDSQSAFEEKFNTYKQRALLGLRIDFRLKNHEKRQQLNRIAALEARGTDELDALRQKVAELEQAYKSVDTTLQEHLQNKDIHVLESQQEGTLLNIQEHKKGFSFFPAFKHVLFLNDSSNFEKVFYASKLTSLAFFIKNNTKYKIKLVGYADDKTGSTNYNKNLSVNRAKNVYNYLLNNGVPANRMEYIGFGGTSKFSINEKSKNRRTEILITAEQ
jgi:outer membrane protein OmpA-like peptidoglycan-associated protein